MATTYHDMKHPSFLFSLSLAAVAVGLIPSEAQAVSVEDSSAQCKALGRLDFSQIPDAPTQIDEAKWTDPSGEMPGFCQVQGYGMPALAH